jgi:hypothetical protein
VRVITRLDETCREVRDAARVIGDAELFQKMEEAQALIKRDSEWHGAFAAIRVGFRIVELRADECLVVFAASLVSGPSNGPACFVAAWAVRRRADDGAVSVMKTGTHRKRLCHSATGIQARQSGTSMSNGETHCTIAYSTLQHDTTPCMDIPKSALGQVWGQAWGQREGTSHPELSTPHAARGTQLAAPSSQHPTQQSRGL